MIVRKWWKTRSVPCSPNSKNKSPSFTRLLTKGTLRSLKEISQTRLLPFLMPCMFSSFDEAHKYIRGVMSPVTHAIQLYSLFPSQNLHSARALQARNYLDDWLRSFEACKKSSVTLTIRLPHLHNMYASGDPLPSLFCHAGLIRRSG